VTGSGISVSLKRKFAQATLLGWRLIFIDSDTLNVKHSTQWNNNKM